MLKPELITYVHSILETERMSVARELHDEMGGLLVAAAMDIAWTEQHLNSPEQLPKKLARVGHILSTAIDLTRLLIERLRPSLLDNFGLFAALRWHVQQACQAVGITCTEEYPTDELPLTADALTGLYRIVQEALATVVKQPGLQSLAFRVTIDEGALAIQLAADVQAGPVGDTDVDAIAMEAVTHRVRQLGGTMTRGRLGKGIRLLTIHIPLSRVLCGQEPSTEQRASPH